MKDLYVNLNCWEMWKSMNDYCICNYVYNVISWNEKFEVYK